MYRFVFHFYCFALGCLVTGNLIAMPNGMKAQSGEASISCSEEIFEIQATDKTILEWKEFSIDKGELTRFSLPNSSSSILNRVMSNKTSSIQGVLESNGRVFLINQNGVVVGKDGLVKTAAFYASTLDVANEEFLLEKELCFFEGEESSIINLGHIEATDGDVVILARKVGNHGKIEAKNGSVSLGAGREIVLKLTEKEKVYIKPQKESQQSEGIGVYNKGSIEANRVSFQADGNLYALAIKDAGHIDALGTYEEAGEIFLFAEDGEVESSSTMKATPGGNVFLLGEKVKVLEGSKIDVSSKDKPGSVRIGGDFQGKNPLVPNSKAIFVGQGVEIDASAKEKGNGGRVILWSNESTTFKGKILAEGKGVDYTGGFVELSSTGALIVPGYVSTLCEGGKAGQLLLDPDVITINNVGPSSPALGSSPYAPPGSAVLLNTDIQTFVNSNNLLIKSNGDITWASGAPITWTEYTLSLEAEGIISIDSGLTASKIAPVEDLIFITSNGTSGGYVAIGSGVQSSDAFLDVDGGNARIFVKGTNDIQIRSSTVGAQQAYIRGRSNAGIVLGLEDGDLSIVADSVGGQDAYIRQDATAENLGDIDISGNPASTMLIESSPVAEAYIQNDSGMTNITMGTVTIEGAEAGNNAYITNSGDSIIFTKTGDTNAILNIKGGIDNSRAYIEHTGSKDIDINLNQVNLTGGSSQAPSGANDSSASIHHSGTGLLSLTVGSGGISLQGGTDFGSPSVDDLSAYILHDGASGDISISTSGDLRLEAGTGSGANADSSTFIERRTNVGNLSVTQADGIFLFSNNLGTTAESYILGTGDVTLNTLEKGLALNADTTGVAYVEGAGDVSITTTRGSIEVNAGNTKSAYIESTGAASAVTITGTNEASFLSVSGGTDASQGYIQANGSAPITISVGSLSLLGGNNTSSTGFQDSSASIIHNGSGNISITTTGGDFDLIASPLIPSMDIADARVQQNGAGNITLDIFGAMNLRAGVSTGTAASGDASIIGNGDVSFTAQSLSMMAGAGTVSESIISSSGGSVTGTVDSTATLTSSSSEARITSASALNLHSGGDMTLSANGSADSKITSTGRMEVSSGGTIFLQGTGSGTPLITTAHSSGSAIDDLLIKAALNLEVSGAGTITNTGGGSLAIVVDDHFPNAPQMGHGRVVTASGATISTAGDLRVFTSHQEFNDIQSLINGALFVPGETFLNTSQEEWGTYFPSLFGGVPFTIFYKNTIRPDEHLHPLIAFGSSELFYRLDDMREDFWILDLKERFLREKKFITTYKDCHPEQFREETSYPIKVIQN